LNFGVFFMKFFVAPFLVLAMTLLSGCLKKTSQSITDATFESLTSGKNAGFRILPQTAARDALRPRVIYRCNDTQCGDAFQPSNEERDIFIPCDAALGTSAQAPIKPYLRLVGEGEKRVLIEKEAHKTACQQPVGFEKLVAEGVPTGPKVIQGAPTCRVFKRLTHPSRNGDPSGGECIGVLRNNGSLVNDPNLPGNFQNLSGQKPAAVWSDPSAYRPSGAAAPSNLK
jgi:hypothetical protein